MMTSCAPGVFGTLELYGQPHNVYHTKLAATADAGSTTLTLAHSVDWNVSTFILINLKITSIFVYCAAWVLMFSFVFYI